MKFLNLVLISCFPLIYARCPPSESIMPCRCYSDTKDVICSGHEVANIQLDTVTNVSLGKLWINNTSITTITNNSLGNASWDKIIISNNEKLTVIDENAFKTGPKLTLMITNNAYIVNTYIHGFLRNLETTEIIQLDGNNLYSLPSNAFNPNSKVKHIHIHEKLEVIRNNTFNGLKELTYVELSHNNISKIEDDGLNFDSNQSIIIFLNNNNLRTNSFANKTFRGSYKNTVELHLENNYIDKLKEEVFHPFLSNNRSILYLEGNDFDCDCDMLWLLKNDWAENNTYSVACNEPKQSLFKLSREQICPTTNIQTTSKTTVSNQKTTQSTTATPSTQKATQSTTATPSTQNTTQSTTATPSTVKTTQSTTATPSTQKATQSTTATPSTQKTTQSTTATPSTQNTTQSTTATPSTVKTTQSTTATPSTQKTTQSTTATPSIRKTTKSKAASPSSKTA